MPVGSVAKLLRNLFWSVASHTQVNDLFVYFVSAADQDFFQHLGRVILSIFES